MQDMKQMSYHYGQLGLSPARGLPESYRTHLKLIVLDRRESRGVIHHSYQLLLWRASPEDT